MFTPINHTNCRRENQMVPAGRDHPEERGSSRSTGNLTGSSRPSQQSRSQELKNSSREGEEGGSRKTSTLETRRHLPNQGPCGQLESPSGHHSPRKRDQRENEVDRRKKSRESSPQKPLSRPSVICSTQQLSTPRKDSPSTPRSSSAAREPSSRASPQKIAQTSRDLEAPEKSATAVKVAQDDDVATELSSLSSLLQSQVCVCTPILYPCHQLSPGFFPDRLWIVAI